MTQEELQAKYDKLVNLVWAFRSKQVAAGRYQIQKDIDSARSLASRVDKIVKREKKEQRNRQTPLI